MKISISTLVVLAAIAAAPADGLAKSRARPRAPPPVETSDDGYFIDHLTGPGGSRTPIMNVPGSATVITRKMMDDFQSRSLCDALRMAPGVTVGGC
jgi:outer membrane receptor for ferric coprogen and ferric-rhodotorulic acid